MSSPTGRDRGVRAVLVNTALVVAAILLSVLLVELALRAAGIVVVRNDMTSHVFDPELGWRPKREHIAWRAHKGSLIATRFNADGLVVGPDAWQQPPDRAAPAVAVIGDSFVEGYYLPWDETFVARLAEALPDRQVLNLGVTGYSPDQYLLRARRILPSYTVEAVVVVLFAYNDVSFVDASRFYSYPKPLLDTATLEPVNLPLVDDGVARRRRLRSSAVLNLLRVLKDRYLPGEIRPPERLSVERPAFHKALRIVRAIGDVVPGAPLHVVYMASSREYIDPVERADNKAIFLELCAEIALRCHYPAMFDAADLPVDEVFIPGDGHLTARGSALFAEALGRVVNAGSGTGDPMEPAPQSR